MNTAEKIKELENIISELLPFVEINGDKELGKCSDEEHDTWYYEDVTKEAINELFTIEFDVVLLDVKGDDVIEEINNVKVCYESNNGYIELKEGLLVEIATKKIKDAPINIKIV